MNSFYHCCGIEYPVEYDEHAKRLAELTDISILFMQADLEIHFSHDRLRVHSQLAEMDENLLLVGSCKKEARHTLTESNSIASFPASCGSLRNILHQCSYKIDLILGQKENRPAKMTPESPDFGFACFAILV
ncbi:hypothetical protein T03_2659 [Trichinella britovi]|uniref:Uncharacterized protein n=4 Tax=Trichinella britovi TaxID=45882 RepID=A0A0V1B5B5_TRIBR|nr:hypothetical protein T03_2659 [Trichinella britovi]